jgi:pyruvate/2-oxoglutarate dehydrogenase complex dihydrolipoamide acyltransferase (E2) component
MTPVVLPDLGDGQVTLSHWYAEVGEPVLAGERVVELLLDHATFEMVAPVSGILVKIQAFPRDRVVPGQTLGFIGESE